MSWQRVFFERLAPGGFSGALFGEWATVLRENNFAVDPKFWPRALIITGNAMLNSAIGVWERSRYARDVARTEVPAPLFVLGLWRSGTTHLHNLLCKDDRFAFPDTYEVLYPHTFLTTHSTGRHVMRRFMPATRPMDRVKAAVEEPQEDELALIPSGLSFMLGQVILTRSRERYQKYLTLESASPEEIGRWKSSFVHFLRKLTFKHRRPLILKSPTHTGRVKVLLELFPSAKFVHIHRDPYAVFQSSIHTWRIVKNFWGLQGEEVDEDRILRDYAEVNEAFFAHRHLLTEDNYCEVRFDDLERDPLGQLRRIYDALALPAFAHAEPAFRRYIDSLDGYARNTFPVLDEGTRRRVANAWGEAFDRWGYPR